MASILQIYLLKHGFQIIKWMARAEYHFYLTWTEDKMKVLKLKITNIDDHMEKQLRNISLV